MAIRLVYQNPQAEFLEGLRRKKGWTYLRVAEEIERQFGFERSEQAIRVTIRGDVRGTKTWRKEPPLIWLIGKVLGASERQIKECIRAAALERLEEQMAKGGVRSPGRLSRTAGNG